MSGRYTTLDIAWMQRNFPPGVPVPEALAQLCAYSKQIKGALSCDFVLTDSGRESILFGFDNVAEAADQAEQHYEDPTYPRSRTLRR
jgi:hypothetical protein